MEVNTAGVKIITSILVIITLTIRPWYSISIITLTQVTMVHVVEECIQVSGIDAKVEDIS